MTQRKRKRPAISDQLRDAIRDSGMTRYEIWKHSGVDQATLSRFVRGKRTITLDGIDKLAALLGLELTGSAGTQKKR